MSSLGYKEWWGPIVRIGVVQHRERIAISARGRYRVVLASGATLGMGGGLAEDAELEVEAGQPAVLGYRLVLAKSPDRQRAERVAAPDPALEPLETLVLGSEFAEGVSSREYWRCSRRFASEEEAVGLQARLPGREQISMLVERVEEPRGCVIVRTKEGRTVAGEWVRFEPLEEEAEDSRLVIHDVLVGVSFHWKHLERQRFRGVVEVRIDNRGLLTAINELPAELYLFSVNSSEMMSVMPEELLKAQTVAARNTLFATMGKHHYADPFDLCADDHCQCYRGSSRETADSRRVTLATLGEVLVHEGTICDCRYSKMCGGIIESFESVWNEEARGYLVAKPDGEPGWDVETYFPADSEERAAALIAAKPEAWCNTTGQDVPGYLRYSAPYFRWEVRLDRQELEKRLSEYLGEDIGQLEALEPLSRGASGRIELLRVVGSRGSWVIGTVAKQYSIREALSPSFLYSSAFVVDYERAGDGTIATVVLRGAGWGHGAGMCQVGATMMAYRGKSYREILAHYYPNSELRGLAQPVAEDLACQLVEREESREGERCYEFFNCYAVASCPVYLKKIDLEARRCSPGGGWRFVQTQAGGVEDLERAKIVCEFLEFHGGEAVAKTQ